MFNLVFFILFNKETKICIPESFSYNNIQYQLFFLQKNLLKLKQTLTNSQGYYIFKTRFNAGFKEM